MIELIKKMIYVIIKVIFFYNWFNQDYDYFFTGTFEPGVVGVDTDGGQIYKMVNVINTIYIFW